MTAPRVALYARYSSDLQNDKSAEDQLAVLRRAVFAKDQIVAAEFRDEEISGSALITRPGVQQMMREAAAGSFDIVMVESLDRLSRGQADVARLYELLNFSGVQLETLSSGRVTELHVGLEGTMNRLFLVELGKKTRRGLEGRVRAGFSAGGRCYGYRVVGKGVMAVDEDEAAIVRQIYAAYAAGTSPKRIAQDLNNRGVPAPRGGSWAQSAISGDRRAQDGILCQELYAGTRVFNRRRYRKHPETGRRSSVLNPQSEWIREPAPDLRIIDEPLWTAVQARQQAISEQPAAYARRPKSLLSGLMRCGLCGGRMNLAGGIFRCATKTDRGMCTNGKAIKAGTIESRVIVGVKEHILTPAAIADAVRVFHAQQDLERKTILAQRHPLERELADIARRIDRANKAYVAGVMDLDEVSGLTEPLKGRRCEIEAQLAGVDAPPSVVQLHPSAAEAYRALAENLETALVGDDAEEVRQAVRDLIEVVEFHPREGKGDFVLTIHGTLASLLQFSTEAQNAKNPRPRSGVSLGAGAGFEPATFRL